MNSNRLNLKKWLWYFTLIAAVVMVYKTYTGLGGVVLLVKRFIGILSPFVGGFVLAFFLYGPSNWLEKLLLRIKGKFWQKVARPIALLVTYLLFFSAISATVWLIFPVIISSMTDLINAMPGYFTAVQEWLLRLMEEATFLADWGLEDKLNDVYNSFMETVTQLITTENLMTALKGVGNVAGYIINVVIAFVVSVYMLLGREHLCKALYNFCGLFVARRPLALTRHYVRRSGKIFSRYIYSALLDALVVGVAVSIGLLIFRVPYAVLLGMLLGVMNLVPYFGAIIGCIIIAFVALLTNGLPTALGVTIYIIVAQQVDANIIQPRIVGDSMGLRPFYVLLSITLFGGLFGFWGILLGPPLMAVVQMIVRDMHKRREKEKKANAVKDDLADIPD